MFPDGSTLTAAPNDGETLEDCVDHEMTHHYLSWVFAGDKNHLLWLVAQGWPRAGDPGRWPNDEEDAVMTFTAGLRGRTGRPWDSMEVEL